MHGSFTPQESLHGLLKKTIDELFPAHGPHLTIFLETPKNRLHGDFTTTIAMRIARLEKKNPLGIAREIAIFLEKELGEKRMEGLIEKVEVLPPGFINFFLRAAQHRNILNEIALNDRFGSSSVGKGIKLQIEFVSANPTGPLSVAHGRQAAIGDSLARILAFCGYEVQREYYVNDVGNQIGLLGKSLQVRYRELFGQKGEIPEGGYRGKYLIELAKEIQAREGDRYLKETEETGPFFERYATQKILEIIQKDLKDFGVHFEHFTHESALHAEGKVREALALLKERGVLYESQGATWFRSTQYGDDKDRVVVKSDETFTYLAPDTAYHREKFGRGFQRLINLWGPDHHGYIRRLKAAVEALGYKKDALTILIVQLATLYREGVAVPMSTRMGEMITLREVMEEVGVDAARFFFVMKKCSSHLDFDLTLARKQTLENPVYTIQYAHARISNIMEFGKEKVSHIQHDSVNEDLLQTPEELEILKILEAFPGSILSCEKTLEPLYLVLYLQKLSGAFHRFYQKHRVVTEDLPLSGARVFLALCVQKVIRQGLSLLGISAPEKM